VSLVGFKALVQACLVDKVEMTSLFFIYWKRHDDSVYFIFLMSQDA